jgi:hypothetical protein
MVGAEQMFILQNLSYSLCQAGPSDVDGVSNYYLPVFDNHGKTKHLVLDIYFLDSHGEVKNSMKKPDYDPIKQSQINWFKTTSRALREERKKSLQKGFHASLTFQHIPLPEFGDPTLLLRGGHRGEPTEGPSENTHFYDTLIEEGVTAIGCGHDHVNDFCALLPRKGEDKLQKSPLATRQHGPWLCHGGCSGFGAYFSYNGQRYYRRTRVWEIDSRKKTIWTWKRAEYAIGRVDELLLMENGVVVCPMDTEIVEPVSNGSTI